jgi:hypothetical protein
VIGNPIRPSESTVARSIFGLFPPKRLEESNLENPFGQLLWYLAIP